MCMKQQLLDHSHWRPQAAGAGTGDTVGSSLLRAGHREAAGLSWDARPSRGSSPSVVNREAQDAGCTGRTATSQIPSPCGFSWLESQACRCHPPPTRKEPGALEDGPPGRRLIRIRLPSTEEDQTLHDEKDSTVKGFPDPPRPEQKPRHHGSWERHSGDAHPPAPQRALSSCHKTASLPIPPRAPHHPSSPPGPGRRALCRRHLRTHGTRAVCVADPASARGQRQQLAFMDELSEAQGSLTRPRPQSR